MRYSRIVPLVLSGVLLYSCATVPEKKVEEKRVEPVVQEEVQRLNPYESSDLQNIVSEENRYHWTSGEHLNYSMSWYNPSLKTLEEGLDSGDLVVVLNEDGRLVPADDARVKYYPDEKSATIEFLLDGDWHETRPGDKNIDLNRGDSGGIYKTVPDVDRWPERAPIDYILEGDPF